MLMAIILYTVHGRGRGHATRTLPIVAALSADGHRVLPAAGEDALPMLAGLGPCLAIRSLRPGMGWGLFPLLVARVREIVRLIRREKVTLVVSDGDLPGLLGATFMGLPAISIGHAEIFLGCRRPAGVPMAPWLRAAMRAFVSAPAPSFRVAVNFTGLTPRSANTTVARPAVPGCGHLATTLGERVVCYFRDDNGAAILQILLDCGERPLLFSNEATPATTIERHPLDRSAFLAALATAKAVVASAGSQLIAECVHYRVPLFVCYQKGDDEQRVNAAMLRSTGLGDGSSFAGVDYRRLHAFLSACRIRPAAQAGQPPVDAATAVSMLVRRCLATRGT